jgi:parallel beta-helix repeat protein
MEDKNRVSSRNVSRNGSGRLFALPRRQGGNRRAMLQRWGLPRFALLALCITVFALATHSSLTAQAATPAQQVIPSYRIALDRNGEFTIYVSGAGATVTLPDIRNGVVPLNPALNLLEDQGGGVWLAHASIRIDPGVTLVLNPATVTWLKLRSQASPIRFDTINPPIVSANFTRLQSFNGNIFIDGMKITSWDPTANGPDTNVSDGRSFVLARGAARMDIRNAELSYLGFQTGESYGVSWRDGDPGVDGKPQTRVTGEVINSTFSFNLFGVYTYYASNMVFRGNKFRNNLSYGFDPHDFSHDFLVEDNEAFENGNHGFIISRGCYNMVFRRNKSYNNRGPGGEDDNRAHGFMIDPGSPTSKDPPAPSVNNLFEQNEAWGNEGYGMRILGSNNNIVRGNIFRDNLHGVTIEGGSTGNVVENNTITASRVYGIYLFREANGNTVTGNTITGSGRHGIYIRTSNNTIRGNTSNENGTVENGQGRGSGITLAAEVTPADMVANLQNVDEDEAAAELMQTGPVRNNTLAQNTLSRNREHGVDMRNTQDNRLEANVIESNGAHGVYMARSTTGNMLVQNRIVGNTRHGIRANGADTFNNQWSENLVSENRQGGIVLTEGAQRGMRPPFFVRQENVLRGFAAPGTVIEVYSDLGRQGQFFEGRTTATADGTFTFTFEQAPRGPNLNLVATMQANSTSFNADTGPVRVFLPVVSR